MLNNLHGDTFFKTATRVSSGTVERFQRSDHPRDIHSCHPGCVDYDLEYGLSIYIKDVVSLWICVFVCSR